MNGREGASHECEGMVWNTRFGEKASSLFPQRGIREYEQLLFPPLSPPVPSFLCFFLFFFFFSISKIRACSSTVDGTRIIDVALCFPSMFLYLPTCMTFEMNWWDGCCQDDHYYRCPPFVARNLGTIHRNIISSLFRL